MAQQQQDRTRAAIYLRVSTDEQADAYGLDVQRGMCEAYAQAFGLTVINTYSDENISGTKPASARPGLAQAIADAHEGRIDVLIFAAIDRLARKASLLLALWDEFEAADVAIVAVKERVDTSTAIGRLMRTMIAAIAEFERDTIVDRTTAGRNARGKQDGERGGRVPDGYQRVPGDGVIVVPDRADVVRQIYDLRDQGLTLQGIADNLNADGYRTARGHIWHASSVREILLNESAYRGGKRGQSAVRWTPILL